MIDDIGLGKAIADAIYLIIIVVGAYGAWLLIKRKKIFGVILWVSFILNILLYLYFMGKYGFYSKTLYSLIVVIWPLVNLGSLFLLLYNFLKNRYSRKK